MSRCHLHFHGHACFTLDLEAAGSLLVDPYRPGGLGGAVHLEAPQGSWDGVLCTHEHEDHCAVDQAPGVPVLASPCRRGPLHIDHRLAAHDEHGGRLRGGLVRLLDLRTPDLRIVHAGDLGERPDGALLDWLRTPRIDVLIAPAGGYFTIGPDAFAELLKRARPRFAVPCHTADDGVALPQLLPRSALRERLRHHPHQQEAGSRWSLPDPPADAPPCVLWMTPARRSRPLTEEP